MKKIISLITLIATLYAQPGFAVGKIQNEDVKSVTDLTNAGSDQTHLINTSKIYDPTNGQQLSLSISNGALGGGSGGAGGIELIPNPNFESNGISNGWSSSGGTFAAVTSGSHLLFGKTSASFLASASNQTVTSTAVALNGLAGTNCSLSLYYTYAGASGDYSVRAYDSTTSTVLMALPLPPQSSASQINPLTFVCPATVTDTVQFSLISNVSSPSTIYFDNAHLGSAQSGIINSDTTPWVVYTPTFTNFGTVTGSLFYSRRVGDSLEVQGYFVSGSSLGAGLAQISLGFNGVNNAVSIDNTKVAVSSLVGNMQVAGNNGSYFGSTVLSPASTSQTFVNFGILTSAQNALLAANGNAYFTSTGFSLFFTVPIVGWSPASDQAVNTLTTPSYWSGYQVTTAGNTGGWNTTSVGPTFVDPTNATGVSLTQTANRNMGTVVTLSTGGPGITLTPPRVGSFEVCAYPETWASASNHVAQFILTDGSNNIISPSKSSISSSANGPSQATMCGQYNVTSVTATTFKLRLASDNGSVSAYIGSNFTGDSAISWTIKELDAPLSSPVFTGNVTTKSTTSSAEILAFSFGGTSETTVCSSSPCTIYGAIDSCISSVTRSSTGKYILNFLAGCFSSAPRCIGIGDQSSNGFLDVTDKAVANSSTQMGFAISTAVSLTDGYANVMCIGPR